MAPSNTPNPHRFLINKIHTPAPPTQQANSPSSQRYNERPRFNLQSSQKRSFEPFTSSSLPRFSTPIKLVHEESIEDASSQDANVHVSIEDESDLEDDLTSQDNDDIAHDINERTIKRQKLRDIEYTSNEEIQAQTDEIPSNTINDDADILEVEESQESCIELPSSSSIPFLSSPDPEPTKFPTSTPRFKFPSSSLRPATPLPSLPSTTSTRPPQFLLPAVEPQYSPHEPLPDHFSPTRRGQRYVSGGLASTMQNWLLNIESLPTSKPRQRHVGDEFLVTVIVDETSGSPGVGTSMIKGRQIHALNGDGVEMGDNLGVIYIILAGVGYSEGLKNGGVPSVGRRIGIKGPMWEVKLEGRKWGVGVNWRVL